MINAFKPPDDTFLVCHCFDMKAGSIRKLMLRKQLSTAEEVMQQLRIGTGCGCCQIAIRSIVTEFNAYDSVSAAHSRAAANPTIYVSGLIKTGQEPDQK
ncbi:MAG: (2Fe-2S)-binding protein [Parahaliea sp.]